MDSTAPHQTDFLTAGVYTHLYPSFNEEKQDLVRSKMHALEYTHMYVYIMNQKDYGGPQFDFYEKPEVYSDMLQVLLNDGIQPVVWLAPDDAPDLHRQYDTDTLIATWKRVIPTIDGQVSSYVLGLEMDEYWDDNQQNTLGMALSELTDKPIFVHMRKELWEQVLLPWTSGIIYQYGFGKTVQEIEQDTKLMLDRLSSYPDKIFIAGEYSHQLPESESRQLGDAAMRAGAFGFGNGGTSF